jgi:transcriptional regulator with XRE-family HTH domain
MRQLVARPQTLLLMWQTLPVDDDLDGVLSAVGPRLRALRRQRETTLTDLSATTGISVSTLSRLESGGRRPTLELLLPLARAFGVQIDELVGAPPTGDPRVHLRPVVRNGLTMVPLTRRPGGVQAYKLIIPASRSAPSPKTHEGYEWIYVLNGRLRLVLGENDLVLGDGEAAEFDTRVPHWFGSAGTTPVEILSLFGRQGERAHLRTRVADGGAASDGEVPDLETPDGGAAPPGGLPDGGLPDGGALRA